MFSIQSVSYNPFIATLQLSSASLNLGQSQNAVSGNGLNMSKLFWKKKLQFKDDIHHE